MPASKPISYVLFSVLFMGLFSKNTLLCFEKHSFSILSMLPWKTRILLLLLFYYYCLETKLLVRFSTSQEASSTLQNYSFFYKESRGSSQGSRMTRCPLPPSKFGRKPAWAVLGIAVCACILHTHWVTAENRKARIRNPSLPGACPSP